MRLRVYTILGLLVFQTSLPAVQSGTVEVLEKTAEYRERLQALSSLFEAQLGSARAEVERLSALSRAGLVARVKVEEAERASAEARTRLEDTLVRIRECDSVAAEMKLAIELETMKPGEESREAVIFSPGNPGWSLSSVSKVAEFYAGHFSVPLPVSAFGQTALHTRLGFAHQAAVDVAVHPDSVEGRLLMDYLRESGVPFIAFRQAVPGSATGAHIHLGPPSLRVAPPSVAEGGSGS